MQPWRFAQLYPEYEYYFLEASPPNEYFVAKNLIHTQGRLNGNKLFFINGIYKK